MILDVEQVFPQFGEMGAAPMLERVGVRFLRIDAGHCAVPAHQRPYLPAAKGATIARKEEWSRRRAALIPDVRSERSHFLIDEAELSPGTPFAAGHEELAFAILEIGQSPPSMFMRAKAAMVNDPEQGAIAEAVYSSEECRYLLVR
jgi:hypothetical protein